MLDDLFELILLIFGDIFDFFRIGRKEKKKYQKEADEKQRKTNRKRPL